MSAAGLDSGDRSDVPDIGNIALSRDVTGNGDMPCPDWCIEHYDAGDRRRQRNHAGFPHSARVADVWTGEPLELGLWLERRDDREAGETETFAVLEVKRLASDVELTVEDMRYLAAKLLRLAGQADASMIGNPSPAPPRCRCQGAKGQVAAGVTSDDTEDGAR